MNALLFSSSKSACTVAKGVELVSTRSPEVGNSYIRRRSWGTHGMVSKSRDNSTVFSLLGRRLELLHSRRVNLRQPLGSGMLLSAAMRKSRVGLSAKDAGQPHC